MSSYCLVFVLGVFLGGVIGVLLMALVKGGSGYDDVD